MRAPDGLPVAVLMSTHFLERIRERPVISWNYLSRCLEDLVNLAWMNRGDEILARTFSKKGGPAAKIFAKMQRGGSNWVLALITVMPPDYKHNALNRARTIDVGCVGPNQPKVAV